MTEKELREKPVKWLKGFLGAPKKGTKHQKILDVFNNSGLYTKYKMTLNDPHCATTVSAAFIATNLTSIFPCISCSCGEMIEKAKKAGIWEERDDYVPKVGDVILYDWDDNGKGDDKGAPEHVGIAAEILNGKKFAVYEGNTVNYAAGTRTMEVNGRYIRGYILPNYKSLATKELPILEKKGYKLGDKTRGVFAFKELLLIAHKLGIVSNKVDENATFGKGTEKAVNKLLKNVGYRQNGIAGKKLTKYLAKLIKKKL